jgi:4-diphosphocytidyl-2-C-methyl-D-erythritol kinase
VIEVAAHAKVNFGLRVGSPRPDGYHPIHGLFQSVQWSDQVALAQSDEDTITSGSGGPVVDGFGNLAWSAMEAVRRVAASPHPVRLTLTKRIPVAAGLGGGSADAAGTLVAAGRLFGVPESEVMAMGPEIGSDVPFCLVGGLAVVTGRGELVSPLAASAGYALGLVVPPVELATALVFAAWDRLDDAAESPVPPDVLPPSLRAHAPLVNDLYPAAVAVAPMLDEWRAELAARWGRPVLMSGSGPSLFGFFVDEAEAREATDDIPVGARAAEAVVPAAVGWRIVTTKDDAA